MVVTWPTWSWHAKQAVGTMLSWAQACRGPWQYTQRLRKLDPLLDNSCRWLAGGPGNLVEWSDAAGPSNNSTPNDPRVRTATAPLADRANGCRAIHRQAHLQACRRCKIESQDSVMPVDHAAKRCSQQAGPVANNSTAAPALSAASMSEISNRKAERSVVAVPYFAARAPCPVRVSLAGRQRCRWSRLMDRSAVVHAVYSLSMRCRTGQPGGGNKQR